MFTGHRSATILQREVQRDCLSAGTSQREAMQWPKLPKKPMW